MNIEKSLRRFIKCELNKLRPAAEIYGGVDAYAVVETVSDELDLPLEMVEVVFREEADKQADFLARVHR